MKKIAVALALASSMLAISGTMAQNTFPATGNVGIGTATPGESLSVNGNLKGYAENSFLSWDEGGQARMGFMKKRSSWPKLAYSGTFAVSQSSGGDISASNTFTDRLVINQDGNVGIGTTVPTATLHVVNVPQTADGNTLILGARTGPNLRLGYNTTYTWIQSHGSSPLRINELGNNTLINPASGNVGIGTLNPREKLSVDGKVQAREVKVTVEQGDWADYVFHRDYKLTSLDSLEGSIQQLGHLPGIPSAAEVARDGLNLGEMNRRLLEKVEELTLYLIDMKKENTELRKRMEKLENTKRPR